MAARFCKFCQLCRKTSFLQPVCFKGRIGCRYRSVWRSSSIPRLAGRAITEDPLRKSHSNLTEHCNTNLPTKNSTLIKITSLIPLEVMPFHVVQGGKFIVHLLHHFQPCKTLILVRTKVLAAELSRQLQEDYGIQSEAAISEMEVGDKQRFLQLEKGEIDVLVTTNSSARLLGVPKVDLVIQVQPPFDGDESHTLYLLQASNFKDRDGRVILLYTKENLEFLSKILKRGIEITKLEPPSFYATTHRHGFVPALHRTVQSLPARVDRHSEESALVYGKKPRSKVFRPVVPVAAKESERHRLSDRVRLYVRGGSGGQGCARFGGLGGDGGDVIVECQRGANIAHFSMRQNRRLIAEHGGNYSTKKRKAKGSRGPDLIVPVPPGTTVTTDDGRFIGDLDSVGARLLVSKGGRGGCPITEGWSGEPGQRHMIRLEMKLIADVGLVGFPNAGKSTLLGAVSRVQPKIGDYAFTTIRPMIGTVNYTDFTQISMADLPGLIEGAHLNRGMGHKFLKHVERTKGLALVADIDGFQLKDSTPHRTAFETVCLLIKELELFQEQLSSRPKVLVISKMDNEGAQEKYEELVGEIEKLKNPGKLLSVLNKIEIDEPSQDALRLNKDFLRRLRGLGEVAFQDIIPVSALMGDGMDKLRERVKDLAQCWPSDINTKESPIDRADFL